MIPRISVIICTLKRPDQLKKSVLSLIQQTLPESEYEVLVVDNNSQDDTYDLIQGIITTNSSAQISYLMEKEVGLSISRNTGIQAAKAEIIAFIDDDAVADSDWIDELLTIYDEQPEAWSVGGKVLPSWEKEKPEWLTNENFRSLSLVEWGDSVRPLTWPERLIGTNCSFRKSVFIDIGKFNTKLGRKGNQLLGNEETEIQERIHYRGKKVFYTPHAIVRHFVPIERMTKDYFYRRSYGNGRTKAILKKNRSVKSYLIDITRNLIILISHLTKYLFNILNEERRFLISKKIYGRFGFIMQSGQDLLNKFGTSSSLPLS